MFYSRPESEEALIHRLMPSTNPDASERARAWEEWQRIGETLLINFVRAHNNTREPDDDLVQEALLTAYLGVERGQYQPREGVPFTAYVKGIARNKIREAWRRSRRLVDLEEIPYQPDGRLPRQPEEWVEQREEQAVLRDGLEKLSGARKQVMLRYLNGERTDEIAERMAMSEALVRQHKCRGLRSMKQRYARETVGETPHESARMGLAA